MGLFEVVLVMGPVDVGVADDRIFRCIQASERNLKTEYDRSKPSINFKLAVDIHRAKRVFGWTPKTDLDEGIRKSLAWYKGHYYQEQKV